jgi:ketosteroid isomerase-like protein
VRAAIEVRNALFGELYASGDSAAMAALYTPDGSVLPPNGAIAAGPEALAAFWGAVRASGVARATLTSDEVFYAGGDVASEVGHAQLALADGTIADDAKYAVIWKQTGAGWRMHRDIWNSNRPAPPPLPPECIDACSRIRVREPRSSP